jgi:hypothetical protein
VQGQFRCYPEDVHGYIGPKLAAQVIYPAVLAAWLFVALVGPVGQVIAAVLAVLIWLAGFVWSGTLPLGGLKHGRCNEETGRRS